jgi:uncharacterized Zn finger protein
MAIPRIPFGNDLPGRLAGTMLKVLAAEMSDPARLSRGQRYFADRAVTDIEVTSGEVICAVQGARPEPYQVHLYVHGGQGVPLRSEMRVHCECADADISMVRACKHAVAAIFTLATEVTIDPEVLTTWRSGTPAPQKSTASALRSDSAGSDSDGYDSDGFSAVPESEPVPARSAFQDRFGELLNWPPGTGPIRIPILDPWAQPPHSNPQLAEILSSALAALELDWA